MLSRDFKEFIESLNEIDVKYLEFEECYKSRVQVVIKGLPKLAKRFLEIFKSLLPANSV